MHTFIISCLFATVLAAPQGYNYNQQQRYDAPVGSTNFNTNSQLTSSSKTQESQGFLQQAFNSGKLPQLLSGGQITAQNIQDFSAAPNFSKFQQGAQQNFGFSGTQQQQNVPNFEGQQQQFNGFQQQQQQQRLPGQSTVTKDIYVHVPPEDVQNPQFQQPVLPPPPPRKHYRIVFIKAPSHNINNALRIQQAPTEEKTIIYVLTKKADPLDIQAALQEAQNKQPSKPEVYFIKYKTQEEAKHAQHAIQAQYEKFGGTTQISDEGIAPVTSVIGSLDGAPQQQQNQPSLSFSNASGHASSSLPASTSSSGSTINSAINNSNKYLPPITKL